MQKKEVILDSKMALKRKRNLRIVALVILGVVVILAGLIIAAACVRVNLKPNMIADADRVTIYDKTEQYGQFSSGEKYDLFMEKFDDMFETNYLVALFSGRLGDYKIDPVLEKKESIPLANIPTFTSVETGLRSGYYVELFYREPQAYRNVEGDLIYSPFNKTQPLTYTKILFAISEKDEVVTIDMYMNVNLVSTANTPARAIKITQKANTNILYQALEELKTY